MIGHNFIYEFCQPRKCLRGFSASLPRLSQPKSLIMNVSSVQCHPSVPPHLSERVFPSSSPESPEMREADWAVAWDENVKLDQAKSERRLRF